MLNCHVISNMFLSLCEVNRFTVSDRTALPIQNAVLTVLMSRNSTGKSLAQKFSFSDKNICKDPTVRQ